jgi:hypothetical protein
MLHPVAWHLAARHLLGHSGNAPQRRMSELPARAVVSEISLQSSLRHRCDHVDKAFSTQSVAQLKAFQVLLHPSQADIMQVILHRLISIRSIYDDQCAANPEAIKTVQRLYRTCCAVASKSTLPSAASCASSFALSAPVAAFRRRLSLPTSNCRAFLSACKEEVSW